MSIGFTNNRNYELMNLENCVALVTGGNRGIGEAFVRVLLAEKGAARSTSAVAIAIRLRISSRSFREDVLPSSSMSPIQLKSLPQQLSGTT